MIVGEAPRIHDARTDRPLQGRPARVLCELAGLDHAPADLVVSGQFADWWTPALYDRFDARNLHPRRVDAEPWSAPLARTAAGALLADDRPVVVVCLGRRVQRAVYGAIDGDVALVRSRAGAWARDDGGGLFGDFGVWAAPWMHRTPVHGEPGRWAPWTVTIPHPSGLNRLLNDQSIRDRCGDVLRQALALAADPDQTLKEILHA